MDIEETHVIYSTAKAYTFDGREITCEEMGDFIQKKDRRLQASMKKTEDITANGK